MSDHKTIVVFGFTAEILDEKRFAFFLDSTHKKTHQMVEHPTVLSKRSIDALKEQALAAGYDQVIIRLDRYIKYSLRSVMQNRSGWYNKETRHTFKDGVWASKVEIDNQTY